MSLDEICNFMSIAEMKSSYSQERAASLCPACAALVVTQSILFQSSRSPPIQGAIWNSYKTLCSSLECTFTFLIWNQYLSGSTTTLRSRQHIVRPKHRRPVYSIPVLTLFSCQCRPSLSLQLSPSEFCALSACLLVHSEPFQPCPCLFGSVLFNCIESSSHETSLIVPHQETSRLL